MNKLYYKFFIKNQTINGMSINFNSVYSEIKNKKTNSIPINLPTISLDLINIATCIHLADKFTRRGHKGTNIYLDIPVYNEHIFNDISIKSLISDILYWYTYENWDISFHSCNGLFQQKLNIETNKNINVLLWSGGLDSFSGLCTELSNNKKYNHLLVSTGNNNQIQYRQNFLYQSIKNRGFQNISLSQFPIASPVRNLPKFFHQRTRGFVFILTGAAYSLSVNNHTLNVYENGPGAINLPFVSRGRLNAHTRSVHPISLKKISDLLSMIIKSPFNINNPFIFSTKGSMVKALKSLSFEDLIKNTISCDHPRRESIIQCGFCCACLLRRMSIISQGINDNTNYWINKNKANEDQKKYFLYMYQQVNNIKSAINNNKLTTIPFINDTINSTSEFLGNTDQNMRQQITDLYRLYVQEWDDSYELISKNIVN